MINKTQAIKIAKDFLEIGLEKEDWFLKVKPSLKAIVLYGSMAKETNRPDSDIDVMVILQNEEIRRVVNGLLSFSQRKI